MDGQIQGWMEELHWPFPVKDLKSAAPEVGQFLYYLPDFWHI